jgi:hypothetical protein
MNRVKDNKIICEEAHEAQKLLTKALPIMNETLTITSQMAVILPYVEDISKSLAVIADELTELRKREERA